MTRDESVEDFSPGWCQKLLNDTSYQQVSHGTRVAGGPNGRSTNSLMGKTLFTDHTFRAIRILYRPSTESKPLTAELLAIISLGDEMCGHANVLHAGVNTTIVGEIGAGLAMRENPGESVMAVNFNVNLRKSVETPGIILVRARMEKISEGRKIWVKCRIEQDGVVCIESDNLYLKLVTKNSKL